MASTFDSTLANLGIGRTNSGPKVSTAAKADTLTQNDFLKLLTAQLKNQDPTDPVDATQQLTQLAQFSSVAGISDINTTLKAIQDKLGATSPNDALAYAGRSVLTAGNIAYPNSTGGLSGAIELASGASDVRVSIQSPSGAIVKSLSLGAQPQGTAKFQWDGTTDNGDPAGDGPFTITATASNAGARVASTTLVWAPVSSVSLPKSGSPVLTLPGIGQVPIDQIREAS